VAAGSQHAFLSIRWLWRLICFPVLLLLVVLEPLISFLLMALTLLGLLTTLFFYFAGPPGFPAGTMLALSMGFALVLVVYQAVIRVLSPSGD
jgi:hypothetical protein